MSSSSLATYKAQSRLVSSLSRIHRFSHELLVLLTYSNQNFWRFYSKSIRSSNGCFPQPMTYSSSSVNDLVSLPNTFNLFFTFIFNTNPPNSTLAFRHNVYTRPIVCCAFIAKWYIISFSYSQTFIQHPR